MNKVVLNGEAFRAAEAVLLKFMPDTNRSVQEMRQAICAYIRVAYPDHVDVAPRQTQECATTARIDIFIAGDLAQAKQVCREFCFEVGLCVSVEPLDYIYTGGEEAGVRVGLINYPRFPATTGELQVKASELAGRLMERLCQHSYSIVGPEETLWVSRRPSHERPHV